MPCSVIVNHDWWYVGEQKTCEMQDIEIYEEDFTILPQTNEKIGGFDFCWGNKKVLFLPYKTHESFPELTVYRAQGCAIATIERKHFKNLRKLKILWLGTNKIEMLPPGVFGDLDALERLALGKWKKNYSTSVFKFFNPHRSQQDKLHRRNSFRWFTKFNISWIRRE